MWQSWLVSMKCKIVRRSGFRYTSPERATLDSCIHRAQIEPGISKRDKWKEDCKVIWKRNEGKWFIAKKIVASLYGTSYSWSDWVQRRFWYKLYWKYGVPSDWSFSVTVMSYVKVEWWALRFCPIHLVSRITAKPNKQRTWQYVLLNCKKWSIRNLWFGETGRDCFYSGRNRPKLQITWYQTDVIFTYH